MSRPESIPIDESEIRERLLECCNLIERIVENNHPTDRLLGTIPVRSQQNGN